MKKLTLSMMLIAAGFAGITSCKKEGCTDPEATNYNSEIKEKNDDGSCEYPEDPSTITVTSNITTNTTWETGKTYILGGRIAVTDGATLTIQPGVIVKGEAGSGANATALIISQNGMIDAQGTATQPIIFTSVADEIEPGQIASPNMDPALSGLWGGLIILGEASISADAATAQIEGIPASDPNGLYGGSNDADNSGILTYVSIRHGGSNIGEGNEINGLTLGGVGSGTTIHHIEIIANQDDGIEFFGGTVSVSDVIVMNNGDDAIDTDQAWNGTLDNVVIINPGDEAFELDGPEGSYVNGNHTITNGTIKAAGASGLVDNDDNTNVDMNNMYFFDLTAGQTFDQVPIEYTCTFSAFQATIPSGEAVADYFVDGSDVWTTDVSSATVGATLSAFSGWSWADLNGDLSW